MGKSGILSLTALFHWPVSLRDLLASDSPALALQNVCSMLDVIYMNSGNPAQVLIFES